MLALLSETYGQMLGREVDGPIGARYAIRREAEGFSVGRDGQPARSAADVAQLFELLDAAIAVEVQRARRDLFFLHAAVFESAGSAFLLAGSSGCGKSTTSWALAHHGFRFLSDELAPVDLDTLEVHPYPRALCLKSRPSASHPLPEEVVRTGTRFHVPTSALPCPVAEGPVPLAATFLLRFDPRADEPSLERLSPARAGACLYTHALNPLAHPSRGLDAALRIAACTRGYELTTAGLAGSAQLVARTIRELGP